MATSDEIYNRMTPQEQQRARQIFEDASAGRLTPAQTAQAVRDNEARVRQQLAGGTSSSGGGGGSSSSGGGGGSSEQCPPGYEKNEIGKCVPIEGGRAPGVGWTPPFEQWPGEEAPPEELPMDQATAALIEWQKAQTEMMRQERRDSAWGVLSALLADYGLGELTKYVQDLIQGGDTEPASLIQQIRQTDAYKKRFPGREERIRRGLNAISEAEYLGLENTYRQIFRSAGLPTGLFDEPAELAQFITYDVSPAEVQARINEGYQQVAQANPAIVQQMTRLYGVTEGELVGYFLDPERALPMLTRRARAAQIAGQGALQAGMEIGVGQAEQLALQGVTQQEAQQGFQTIAGAQELFGTLAGTTEEAIGAEEQVAGIFGTSAAAQQRIRQRTRERQTVFEAGGRFATGQGGTVTGLQ